MLIDSNIIIYAAKSEYSELRQFIAQHSPSVSVISYVEVLGYHLLAAEDKVYFETFFKTSRLIPISQEVLNQAINLKQQRKILLGDSLIAGTALSHNLTLVTHNVSDFKWIDGLTVLDPLSQKR